MKRFKNLFFYILVLGVFLSIILLIIRQGTTLQSPEVTNKNSPLSAAQQFRESWMHQLTHPLAMLILQVVTIILAARIFGFLCRKIKQPTVIGEIIAGIVLGPSLAGYFFPDFSAFIFPPATLGNLQFLSQIGLILFMFIVGMELDLEILKNKAREAVIISHASILFPFALGVALAFFLYHQFAPTGVAFVSFALFTGISLSVTAFPVLARIVQEKGLSKTRIGAIAITCAAADDITAWCILAAVIAIVKAGSLVSALYMLALAAVYVLVMLRLVRPFLEKLGDKYANREGLSKPVVAIFFIVLLMSAWLTEVIGIHALFGAFLAGVIMPPNIRFRSIFIEKIEDISLVLLLPLFFVFTGLRTQIGLLNSVPLWGTCAVIVLAAVAGKFLGSALAARYVGQSWSESLSIGALMNTRGLMELVVLNIGYDLGVLSPAMFAMMVIMALATTLMTSPALALIKKFSRPEAERKEHGPRFNILVSFGNPQRGVALVRLAGCFVKKSRDAAVTALHLSPANEISPFNMKEHERESFRPVKTEAKKLNISLKINFKPSQDISSEIIETANQGDYHLLMIGYGHSVYEGTLLGRTIGIARKLLNPARLFNSLRRREKLFREAVFDDTVNKILRECHIPVGILMDKKFSPSGELVLPLLSEHDAGLLPYAQMLLENSDMSLTIVERDSFHGVPEMKIQIDGLKEKYPSQVRVAQLKELDPVPDEPRLLLISLQSWVTAVENHYTWITAEPSALIVRI